MNRLGVTAGGVAAGLVAYARWLRPHVLNMGARRDEIEQVMPGDEIVTNASLQTTRAITQRKGNAGLAQLRAAIVTFGPSVLLDAIVALGVAARVRALFRCRLAALPRRIAAGASLVGAMLAVSALRGRLLRWGATADEVRCSLPGDEIVPQPVWESTRAITIDASPDQVWPWLVQMGQGRGGLYSFDWLENLAGLEIHSTDRILPECQLVAVGDAVRLAPDQDSVVVALVEPERALVLRIADPQIGRALAVGDGAPFAGSWAFVLQAQPGDRTRLLIRFRFEARTRLLGALGYPLMVEVPHFVMEWRMLHGIKERAERTRTAHLIPAA
jgi:hypothetical protein